MKFRYFTVNDEGSQEEGTIEASSSKEAQEILARRDIIATKIESEEAHREKEQEPIARVSSVSRKIFGKKASVEDLADLSYELSILLESGLSLPDALTLYAGDSENCFDRELRSVVGEVRGGTSFSEALKKREQTFPAVFSAMVHSGEKAGKMPSVLQVLAKYFEQMDDIKNRMISAASYPLFVAVLAFVVIFALIIFIVPIFAKIYNHMGIKLPLVTRIFLSVGNHKNLILSLLALIVIGIVAICSLAGKNPRFRERIDRLKISLWLTGPISRDMAITNFSVTMGMLCENGLKLHEAIDLAAEASGNIYMEKKLKSLKKGLCEGKSLSSVLSEKKIMDSKRLGMIKAGEHSGNIGGVLMKLSEIIFTQVDHKIKRLLGMLEPVLVIIIGIAVGSAIISLALPILNLSSFLNK